MVNLMALRSLSWSGEAAGSGAAAIQMRFREEGGVPTISIHKLCELDAAASRSLQEIQAVRDEISRRVYDLYQARGATPGGSVDDWLRAEREVCWVPQEELEETDRAFHLRIGMSGVPEETVEVTLLPEMVILRGAKESGSGAPCAADSCPSVPKVLFRQIVFPFANPHRERGDPDGSRSAPGVSGKGRVGVNTIEWDRNLKSVRRCRL